MRKLFTLLPLLVITTVIHAQSPTFKGKVLTDTGPVANATIIIKGTKLGTVTDATGSFSIQIITLPATLIISAVGNETKEIKVTGRDSSRLLTITLAANTTRLEEVVVTGYSSSRRREMSYEMASAPSVAL
ncbi:MAG TPA: carboxypeptidase-like regulatory domain-containing protein, partial [Hymenobacter sp.]